MPHATLCAQFDIWCREAETEWGAAEGCLSWRFAPYGGVALQEHHTTSIDPAENQYFAQFKSALEDDLGITLETEVCIGLGFVVFWSPFVGVPPPPASDDRGPHLLHKYNRRGRGYVMQVPLTLCQAYAPNFT